MNSIVTGTTESVKRVREDSLQETYHRDGKEVSTDSMIVAADGTSVKNASHDMQAGRSMISVAKKQ